MWLSRIANSVQLKRFFSKKYTVDHEWVSFDKTSSVGTIGITEYAQQQLGDVVHIDLPKISQKVIKKGVMATIESVKVVSEIYAPVTGQVLDVNKETETHPEIINQDAENRGWLFKVKLDDPKELNDLLDKAGYDKFIKENAH